MCISSVDFYSVNPQLQHQQTLPLLVEDCSTSSFGGYGGCKKPVKYLSHYGPPDVFNSNCSNELCRGTDKYWSILAGIRRAVHSSHSSVIHYIQNINM